MGVTLAQATGSMKSCTFEDCGTAIHGQEESKVSVDATKITESRSFGVVVQQSNADIRDLVIEGGGVGGAGVAASTGGVATLQGVTIRSCKNGLEAVHQSRLSGTNVVVSESSTYAAMADDKSVLELRESELTGGPVGVAVAHQSTIRLVEVSIHDCADAGLYVAETCRVEAENANIRNNALGVKLGIGAEGIISGSDLSDNRQALEAEGSHAVLLRDNTGAPPYAPIPAAPIPAAPSVEGSVSTQIGVPETHPAESVESQIQAVAPQALAPSVPRKMNLSANDEWALRSFYGEIHPAVICPHCQTRGYVRMKQVKVKQGISGGKATAAVLTAGFSLLATGLSRKAKVTQAHCDACNTTWYL